ncbi:IMP dehydrogenase [Candidatus Woesearchaeota archaeon]|nr:IMP dehydrogenase [Candidatus Woesearchaeota archaeon]
MVKILERDSTTFSEYLIVPRLTTKDCVPKNVSLRTPLTKYNRDEGLDSAKIVLNLPFLSASMQAVTGPEMAIAMAQQGCMGVVFCSQPIEKQAEMIEKVKQEKRGFVDAEVLYLNRTIEDAMRMYRKTGHSIYPIVDSHGKLEGSIHVDFLKEKHLGTPLEHVMWKFEMRQLDEIIDDMIKRGAKASDIRKRVEEYIPFQYAGISLKEANNVINMLKKKFLVIVDDKGKLDSIVFRKDIERHLSFPNELIDEEKRYIVGAGINTHDYSDRIPALVEAGADVLCTDSSDIFSEFGKECILHSKKHHEQTPVMGGNIVTGEAFDFLVRECHSDCTKVGMGGGSICITRDKKGVGRGQADAVLEVCEHRDRYFEETGIYVPVYSDGGHREANDILAALAFGADGIMGGKIFAGAAESPAPFYKKDRRQKEYWGEGSNRARNYQRYSEGGDESGEGRLKFEEGVDALVPYAGPLENIISGLLDIMKSTMIDVGAKNIKELQEKAVAVHISQSAKEEGHPSVEVSRNHDNYKS